MDRNQLFGLFLVPPYAPNYAPTANLYVGTKEEILAFLARLEDSYASKHFSKLIKAVRMYSENPTATHVIGGKEYPVLVPVRELARKELTLENHTWIEKSQYTKNQHLLHADFAWISYLIVEYGSCVCRCCKVMFDNLSISVPGLGRITIGAPLRATPGMTYYEPYRNNEGCITHMSLFCADRTYQTEAEINQAIAELPGMLNADVSAAIMEILGPV